MPCTMTSGSQEERWNDGEDKVPLRPTEHGEKLAAELVEPLQLVALAQFGQAEWNYHEKYQDSSS